MKYRDRATEVALFRYALIRAGRPGSVQGREGQVGAGAGRQRPTPAPTARR